MTNLLYISSYSYPFMTENHVVCKHILLVKRAYSYNIGYDIRKDIESMIYPKSSETLPQPEEAENHSLEMMFDQVLGDPLEGLFHLGAEDRREMEKKNCSLVKTDSVFGYVLLPEAG